MSPARVVLCTLQDEFVEMVRNDLKLSARALPEMHIRAAWLALDTDGSGHLSSGEFGAFMRLAAPQADHAAAHRASPWRTTSPQISPPRSAREYPRAFASPRRAPPVLSSESFLTHSTKDAKKLRAQTDAEIERALRASRTRHLIGGVGTPDYSPRSSPHRPQSQGWPDDARDAQALENQHTLAQPQARRLELEEAQCAAAEASAAAVMAAVEPSVAPTNGEVSETRWLSLATLLAHVSREELVKSFEALPPARRQLVHDLTRLGS